MPKIMVIDDDLVLLKMAERVLKKAGYKVITLSQSQNVLPMAMDEQPDIIITDVMMPQYSGEDVIRALSDHPDTRNIPIMVLSAQRGSKNRAMFLRSGAMDYIEKPFEPDELLARIERQLSQRELFLSGFQGAIDYYPLVNLAQHLAMDQRNGLLQFHGPNGNGVWHLVDGALFSAHFGGLESVEAFWSMLEEKEGRFQFLLDAKRPEDTSCLRKLPELLLEYLWVIDELDRHEASQDACQTWLRCCVDQLPPVQDSFGKLPIEPLFQFFKTSNKEQHLTACLRARIAAPSRIRLSLCWMLENGILQPSDQKRAAQNQPLLAAKERQA